MRDIRADILSFWFEQTAPAQWFGANPEFDAQVRDNFADDFDRALGGVYDGWAATPEGALALIVLLDQFPRNMFRGTPRAFAGDVRALATARATLAAGFDQIFASFKRRFFYLPFEHSEDAADQAESVRLFAAMKDDDPLGYEYALRHQKVIDRFGRFPHRNPILGRASTPAEQEFLTQNPTGF